MSKFPIVYRLHGSREEYDELHNDRYEGILPCYISWEKSIHKNEIDILEKSEEKSEEKKMKELNSGFFEKVKNLEKREWNSSVYPSLYIEK